LTKKQFFQPDLGQKIAQIMKENKLPHSCLRLEISEKIITEDEAANAIFVNLKAQGFQLLIDNCGSNNSSVTDLYNLLRLKYGKFDSIKLDRSLISSLEKSPDHLKTIHKMLGFAQELGMQMIVMGIETAGQMSQITQMKCVYGQGNFFSQPLPGDATIKLVAAR
jgi:EAL domain-containing protein (putative c-di-GMP-specific phosphodiesterase class I)